MVSIIGSRGFIGSALVPVLKRNFITVHLFNSESKYLDDNGLINENLINSETIVWCASRVNPISGQNNPKLISDEIELWRKFVELISKDCEKSHNIVFMSSGGCVYSGNKPPFREDSEAEGSNDYGIMKRDMEKILVNSGLQFKILRVANVYGPGQKTGKGQGVLAEWANRIKNNEPIEIFGDINSYRDYIHVQDLCSAIYNSLALEGTHILNIGSGVATSLSEIIHLFKKNSEIDFCVNELEARDVDRDSYWLDTTKAQKLLNWKPRIFLHEGIKEILK